MRGRSVRRRSGGAQDGFTLIELLVAAAAGIIVVGALATMMASVLRAQPESQDRAAQLQDARVMLERMVRDLRQGAPVTGASANASQVTVDTYTRGGCNGGGVTSTAVLCRVTYTCAQSGATASCTRRAGTGTAVRILTGLRSAQVFSYGTTTSPTCNATTTSSPSLICITLAYPAPKGEESLTVEDSAYLRNPGA